MSKLKRITMATLSASILLTQGGPLPYLAYAMDSANMAPINGEVTFSWTTSDRVTVGSTFNPYEGLKVIDADGDNVAVLATVSGEVDTSQIGSYSITYSIENADGETFTMDRQIEVVSEQNSDVEANVSENQTNSTNQDEIQQEPSVEQNTIEEVTTNDDQSTTISSVKLNDVAWTLYDQSKMQELMKFNVNVKTGYYEGYIGERFKSFLINTDEETLNQEVLQLRIWSETGSEKLSLTLTVRDLLDETNGLKVLTELKYEIGDQLSLIPILQESTTLVVDGVTSGDISNEKADYENGVQNEDYLQNVRFQLTVEGLKTIYNEAPVFEGLSDYEWNSSEEVDPLVGIKVTDDHDGEIDLSQVNVSILESTTEFIKYEYTVSDSWGRTSIGQRVIYHNRETQLNGKSTVVVYKGENFDYRNYIEAIDKQNNDLIDLVEVVGEVDVNKVGDYQLQYSLTDQEGQQFTFEQTVKVIEKNIFNVFAQAEGGNKNLGFSFYINPNTLSFIVENQSELPLNPMALDEEYATVKIFNENHQEKLSITLLGKDTGNSEKLEALKTIEYTEGDLLQISVADSKNNFTISGPLEGDVSSEMEDYTDGVDDLDFLHNVRFKLTTIGVTTVYNHAPEIQGLTLMSQLLRDRTSQLEGVVVTDDHDGIISNENVMITEERNSDDEVIGLRYMATDSWGRTVSALRLIQGYENEGISLYSSRATSIKDNTIEVHGVGYSDGETLRFKIGFNPNEKVFTITDNAAERLLDNKFDGKYFELIVYDSSGALKTSLTLNGNDKANSKKLTQFNETSFEYGDQIHLYHYYSESNLKIKGEILDKEDNDFSNGVSPEQIAFNRFELTQEGLKFVTNEAPVIKWGKEVDTIAPDKGETIAVSSKVDEMSSPEEEEPLTVSRGSEVDLLADVVVTDDHDIVISNSKVSVTPLNTNVLGKQTITYSVTDSWGATTTRERTVIVTSETRLANTSINFYNGDQQLAFSLTFDDYNKQIFVNPRSESVLNPTNSDDVYIKLAIYSKAGITKKEITLTGNDTAVNKELLALNNYRYTIGDQIEIWVSNPQEAVKIVGDIDKDEKVTEDYSDGIYNTDFMNNVRFELQTDCLKAVYNEVPTFVFVEEGKRIFQRTEDGFNPLDYVQQIKDDHDNLNKNSIRVSYDKDLIQELGEHEITYTIKDKWGRSTTQSITIRTVPKNSLENTQIQLIDPSDSTKPITVSFDDVEKNLVIGFEANKVITGTQNTDVFTLKLFDSDGKLKAQSVVKANVPLNYGLFSEIMGQDIEYGDYLFVSASNYENLLLNGDLVNSSTNSNDKLFENNDKMRNTRFKISADGLEAVYNKAPKFIAGVEDISIEKDSDFNPLYGVVVTDDHDGGNLKITVTPADFNTSESGDYVLTYTVTDSWGRTTSVTRNVYIKTEVESNTIEYLNSNNEVAFTIGFDFQTNRLVVSNQSGEQLNSSNPDTEFFMILFDENNNELNRIELNGTDTPANLEEELAKARLREGYKLFVWGADNEKLSINGYIIRDSSLPMPIDELSGIDYQNTIFTIKKTGLYETYNQAPVIEIINENEEVTLYKGDDYRANLLEKIIVSDDRDEGIDLSAVEIQISRVNDDGTVEELGNLSELESDDLTLGDYTATYTIKDSWHRVSNSVSIDISIVNSLKRNEFIFGGHKEGEGSISDAFRLKFDVEGDNPQLKLEITRDDLSCINNRANGNPFYKITVIKADGSETVVQFSARDTAWKTKLQTLNDLELNYGDKIHIYAFQTFRMSLIGTVRNPFEQDENGYATIDQGDDFNYTKFVITEEGLKAEYTNPVPLSDKESLIEYYTAAVTPFKMKINHETGSITFPTPSGFYDYNGSSGTVFTIVWHKADGTTTRYEHDRRDQGASDALRTDALQGIQSGDYFTIECRYPERVRLTGAIVANSTEVTNTMYLNQDILDNSRLYPKEENKAYMNLIYNFAPEFKGVEDVNIYVGDTFTPQEGVSVTDDFANVSDTTTGDTQFNFVEYENYQNNPCTWTYTGAYDNQNVGSSQYTYKVTDSWGRTTEVTRTIYVRPESYKNKIMLYAKESETTITDDSIIEPVFEILFDNETHKYEVVNQLNQKINDNLYNEVAFSLEVYDASHNQKIRIELNGNDTGTSSKLDALKEINYEEGDYIKLSVFDSQYLCITGTILGDSDSATNPSDTNTQLLVNNNGFYSDDYIKNTVFETTNNGLNAIYNEAPKIKVQDKIEVSYATENLDLTKFITITDDKDSDEEILKNIKILGEVDTNTIGDYKVTYTVTDSWGRTSSTEEVTISVVSNMKNNKIEVYTGENNNTELQFTILFDIETNRLKVESSNTSTPSTNNSSETYFKLVVRDNEVNIKHEVEFTLADLTSQDKFNEINNIVFAEGDYISVESTSPSNIKIKGTLIKTNSDNTTEIINEFANGFTDKDQMKNHRFKVTTYGFELIEREDLNVSFVDSDIQRGDEYGVYSCLSFDYENRDSYEGVHFLIEGFDPLTLGEQEITYVITDSWGSCVRIAHTVTVVERNNLEKNRISLKSTNNETLVDIFIDTIENQLVVQKGTVEESTLEGNLLTVTLYDADGVTKGKISITSSNLNTIAGTSVDFEEGDFIGLTDYYNYQKLMILGDVEDQKEDYTDGVNNEDNIENVRFKIGDEDSGLKSIYNNALILQIEGNLVTYKNENPDLYEGIMVSDEDAHDKDRIMIDDIQIETELDITRIGTYNAKYILADTWGRTTEAEREIEVKSSLEKNEIQYFPSNTNELGVNGDLLFSIKLDIDNNQLKIEKDSEAFSSTNSVTQTVLSEEDDNVLFGVSLYNSDMKIKKTLKITLTDTLESINEKLNQFDNTQFEIGDYIRVYAQNHQSSIKIIGNMKMDAKITEDYSQGIKNQDFMNNVRFKINADELHAIYNEAPEIQIPDNIAPLEYYSGDDIYIGDGLTIRDDHDTYINNKLAEVVESDKELLNRIGEHTIHFTVADSWGRITQTERQVVVKNALKRNEFIFGGHKEGEGDISDVFRLKFDVEGDNPQLKLEITRDDLSCINDRASGNPFYTIQVFGENNNEVRRVTFGARESRWKELLETLNNLDLEYGYSIKIYAFQTPRMSIIGTVRDAWEDYSSGVSYGEIFNNTIFYITEQGLKAVYVPPVELADNESLIQFNAGAGIPLKLKINHDTGAIEAVTPVSAFYHWGSGNNVVFKLSIHQLNGDSETVSTFEYRGQEQGAGNALNTFIGNHILNPGDYITFETPYIDLHSRIELWGNIIIPEDSDESLKSEDFEKGIKDKETMERGMFIYNKDNVPGITVVKKSAPMIEGADDIRIPQVIPSTSTYAAQNLFDPLDGVMATDNIDGALTGSIDVTGHVDQGTLGMYELVYTVTNSLDVTTTVYRNVTVYSESALTPVHSDDSRPPIEQGSYLDDEELKKHLLTYVRAYDTEDNDIQDKIVVESHNIAIETPNEYQVTYSVTNSFGETTKLTIPIKVVRTIAVSVPVSLPFQIVTNLLDESDPFIAGILKIKNEKTSSVDVYLQGFEKVESSGDLEIVNPNTIDNWETLSVEESMKKMSLGLYMKSGLTNIGGESVIDNTDSVKLTQENPLWLYPNMTTNPIYLGQLARRATTSSNPTEAQLSFVSEHGSNFEAGKVRGQFRLILEFR